MNSAKPLLWGRKIRMSAIWRTFKTPPLRTRLSLDLVNQSLTESADAPYQATPSGESRRSLRRSVSSGDASPAHAEPATGDPHVIDNSSSVSDRAADRRRSGPSPSPAT